MTRLLWLALPLLFAGPALWAQDQQAVPTALPMGEPVRESDAPRPGTGGPSAEEAEAAEEEAPITVEVARANFASIVETFVAKLSPEGFWPFRDKKSGRVRRLQLLSVDARRVRAAGGTKFKGPATLKDLGEKKTVEAEFIVDLSGTDWRVTGLRLLDGAKAKPRKKP